jgi:hypothetical protein
LRLNQEAIMATRGTPRPPKTDAASVRANSAADKARKAKSKAALRASTQAPAPSTRPEPLAVDPAVEAKRLERVKQDAVNALQAHWVDFCAIGALERAPESPDTLTGEGLAAWESYLREQGLNPDGTPNTGKAGTEKPVYIGPMLALRERSKAGAYVRMPNGNPSCADWLATALGALNREQVVQVLIIAMKLPGNPYTHLNPGQQSMNLRNKARGLVKNGLLTQAEVEVVAAVERASRHPE